MLKQYRIEIKWAIINSIFLLIWTAVERLTGLHDRYIELQQNLSLFLLIPAVLFYVLMLIDKNKHFYKSSITYIQGFFSGLLLTVGIMILTPLVQYINYYLISPHFFSNLVDFSIANGTYTKEQAVQELTYGKYLFISEIFQMLTGAAFSALIPLFMSSKPVDEGNPYDPEFVSKIRQGDIDKKAGRNTTYTPDQIDKLSK